MASLLSYLPDDIATAPRTPRKKKGGNKSSKLKEDRKYPFVDSEDDTDGEHHEDEEGAEEEEDMTPIEPPVGNTHLLDPKALRTYSSPSPLTKSQRSNYSTAHGQQQQQYVAYSPQNAPEQLHKRTSGRSLRLRGPEELPQLHDSHPEAGSSANGLEESSSHTKHSENTHMHIDFKEGPNLILGGGGHSRIHRSQHQADYFRSPPLLDTSYVEEVADREKHTRLELAESPANFGNRHSSVVGSPGNYGNRQSLDYDTGEETETPTIGRRGFFSKLKALGHTATHGRNPSGWTVDTLDDSMRTPRAEAIEDDSEDERRARRRSFSPGREREARTAPTTPRSGMRRRATMTGIPEEGFDRRRPSSSHARFGGTLPTRRFPGLDYFRYHGEGSDAQTPGEVSSSFAKWQKLMASVKLMGRGKKEESKVDREKSAELVAELTAGTPAVAMLASMFQRDEHGNKRIPVLLEQLKVRIVDSRQPSKGTSRYHTAFRIELEYGSGLTRMAWLVHREFRDFVNLHSRYKLADISNTTFSGRGDYKLPKFPRATIPYLRGVRGLGSDEEDADADQSATEDMKSPDTPMSMGGGMLTPATLGPANVEDAQQQLFSMGAAPVSPAPKTSRVPFFGSAKKLSPGTPTIEAHDTMPGITAGIAAAGIGTLVGAIGGGGSTLAPLTSRRDTFAIRQRKQLEEYLQGLIRVMIFRPDSNRLCKFLELSALGVRLAAENSYHGKEGYLIIRSAKGSDYRKGWTPAAVAQRHRPKWFLVRHSYIVCVESPEEMNIYDVFLVDSHFEVDAKKFLSKKSIDPAANSQGAAAHAQHHSLTIKNTERTVKLLAKHERQLQQFYESISYIKEKSIWSKQHRLGSFAPVRKNVFAQWLVDGRDYMWNVSRAISMAKDVIYIHDWWLSPELVSLNHCVRYLSLIHCLVPPTSCCGLSEVETR